MKNETLRRCPECGVMTKSSDYCKNCGTLINTNLRRQLEREKRATAKLEKEKLKEPNAVTEFFEKARNHKNPIIRVLVTAVYSIWMVVFAIGAFFAYIIGYIAA
mgnify:CR=1 FL=1